MSTKGKPRYRLTCSVLALVIRSPGDVIVTYFQLIVQYRQGCDVPLPQRNMDRPNELWYRSRKPSAQDAMIRNDGLEAHPAGHAPSDERRGPNAHDGLQTS